MRSIVVIAAFFLSTGWTIRNLGTFPGGGASTAAAINKHGQGGASALTVRDHSSAFVMTP